MTTVNIHHAKTHLSRLLEQAAGGETIIIAKAGRPIAKLVPLDPPAAASRLGFMAGQVSVPDNFNEMFQEDIEEMFYG